MNPQAPQPPARPLIPLSGGGPQASEPSVPPGPKQQIVNQIQSTNNVLVTVSNNPSVDQLAAAIGFTLVLNKLGKHATAVFSGKIPSTIEFLQPEKTFEKNTDSLRDFIIALDKSKADKLRYKVEDTYVKIFITPYHTSLNEKDLEFSQGDFNVDLIFALGVKTQNELDQAVTAHGRILHDATVISINSLPGANLGAINLNEPEISSLCEILVSICDLLGDGQTKLLDAQVATAFLTGIVAETNRFSNNKTKPQTMTASAKLMNAGANQQLVVSKLEPPKPIPAEPAKVLQAPSQPVVEKKLPTVKSTTPKPMPKPKSADGSLSISHGDNEDDSQEEEDFIEKIHIDDEGTLKRVEDEKREAAASEQTAPEQPEPDATAVNTPTLGASPPTADSLKLPPVNGSPVVSDHDQTLTDIEKTVHSKHLIETQPPAGPAAATAPTGNSDERAAFPSKLVMPDDGPPKDETGGSADPTPPPVPPPFMMPPNSDEAKSSDGPNGIPL